MRRVLAGLLGAIILAAGTGGPVRADDPVVEGTGSVANVKVGEYRDLTLLRKLKLGTAPYVNPGLLKQAVVAYKYDPEQVLMAADPEQFQQLVQAGDIGLATKEDGAYRVITPGDASVDGNAREIIKRIIEAVGKSRGTEYVVISNSDQLLGTDPAGAIVSWYGVDPMKPIAEPPGLP